MQGNSVLAAHLAPHRHVVAWMERIRAFGHGSPVPLPSGEAVDIARRSTPKAREAVPALHGGDVALGDEVEIAADDYALEPSAGRLVLCTADELAIARTDARAGDVVVHFPRIGFQVTRRAS
jgi:hypothetical protein